MTLNKDLPLNYEHLEKKISRERLCRRLVATILVCLKQIIKMNCRVHHAVKLECKRSQHAIPGLLFHVPKIKEEAEDKPSFPFARLGLDMVRFQFYKLNLGPGANLLGRTIY